MRLEHDDHDMDFELGNFNKLTPEVLDSIQKCAALKQGISFTMDFLKLEHHNNKFDRTEVQNRLSSFKKAATSPMVPQTLQMISLLHKEKFTLETQDGWYYDSKFDDSSHLTGVFWMSPEQRNLYHRYHDVVVNDTTRDTNRLDMKLNCSVVVDARFKTRLIACALIRHETESDYAWILEQLKRASGNIQPSVIMVDEDASMDAACHEVFPGTQIVNCIWHVKNNLKRHLMSPLGGRYEAFMWAFEDLCKALTSNAFDELWASLLRTFNVNENGSVYKYLTRIYKRRHHWAGPWVQAAFTAGMRSTQRVEKNHHLIKLMDVNSKTSLPNLLETIGKKVDREFFDAIAHVRRESFQKPPEMIDDAFDLVIKMNDRFLASFARDEMRHEMTASYGFRHSPFQFRDVKREMGDSDDNLHQVRWRHVFMPLNNLLASQYHND